MSFSLGQIISWIIVGLIAGSLAGSVLKRSRHGYGRWANWGIGLVGAIIGGLLFSLFRVDFGLRQIVVSLADIVQAFIGALIFALSLTLWRGANKRRARQRAAAEMSAVHAEQAHNQSVSLEERPRP